MMAKAGRPWPHPAAFRLVPAFHRTWQERGKNKADGTLAFSLGSTRHLCSLSPFGQPHWPTHDAILEVFVGNLVLSSTNLAAHGHAGRMHGVGVARDQWMPPIEVVSVGHQAIAAGRRQPDDPVDIAGRQPDAVVHFAGSVRVVP